MRTRRLVLLGVIAGLLWPVLGAADPPEPLRRAEGLLPVEAPPRAAVQPERAPDANGPADPPPVAIHDEFYRVEFQLPAPYWTYHDSRALAERATGGCSPPRVPPNLVFLVSHKDAPVTLWCEAGPRPFLMRDKADMEAFVNAFVDTVRQQVRAPITDSGSSYGQRDGMIVHRFWFTTSATAGGGCRAQQPAEEPQKMRYLFVHYFVRPEGADAVAFKLLCGAPLETFEQLEPEIAFTISSLRYAAPVAEEFFVPDAPTEKLLTAKEAARAAGSRRRSNWLMPVALVVIVWIMLRRRKASRA